MFNLAREAKQESNLVAIEQGLGLTGLDQPTELAALAAEAERDPMGWIKVHAPRLLATHILALTALAESTDLRIRGTALKSAGDLTCRALALLGVETKPTTIRSQSDIPNWLDIPQDIRVRFEEIYDELEARGAAQDVRQGPHP